MNISCDIIKDLLPLYHDDVCSEASKAMVEHHLSECQSCLRELEAMDRETLMSNKEQNMAEANEIKKLSERWKKGMIKSTIRGVFFTLLTMSGILLAIYCLVGIQVGW